MHCDRKLKHENKLSYKILNLICISIEQSILDHILWLPVNIKEVKQFSELLSETKKSVGGSLRIIITVLGDICWHLIGRCWCSEPSDWQVSLDALEGIFHVSSALQLPLSTFNQVSSIWWSHFIQHYHHLRLACFATLKPIFVLYIITTWTSPSWRVSRYLCWNYGWFVDIKCGIILREG